MAGTNNRRPARHGGDAIGVIATVIAICVAIAIAVETGAWDTFAVPAGLPRIGSVEALKPDAYAQGRPQLATPDTTQQATGTTGGSTTTPHDTGTTGGSQTDTTQQATPHDTGTIPAAAKAPIDWAQAADMATHLTTATPHTAGYDRQNDFGGWANADSLCGTGTTRDLILGRDLADPASNPNCKVISGTLHDPYTGQTIAFRYGRDTSADVQIDHVVALADAWASGLWQDGRENDRTAYANDPDVLLASQGDANNRKSEGINLDGPGVPTRYAKPWKNTGQARWTASTPSVWLPDNASYRCDYMAKRVWIKHKWNLTMSAWEKTETIAYLQDCAAGRRP